jgi:hypothetical protein
MKGTKILTTMVLAMGLAICLASLAWAAPMGTAYTYQGRLIEGDETGDGLYDFTFKLFDDPCTGTQQAGTVIIDDLDVIDGYFTAVLDFGAAFNGNARWLEIAVRPGASIDGNDFLTLLPRQEVTPTPQVLYAQKAEDANTVDGLHGKDLAPIIHTHSAGSITSGTLSTSRYSAFSDLLVEGYLGDAVGDIAQNNGVLQPKLNADALDGFDSSEFLNISTDYGRSGVSSTLYEGTSTLASKYLGISAMAADSDRLDGLHASAFAPSSHNHNTLYYTEAESDSRFVNVTGDTMTGELNMNTTGTGIDIVANPSAATTYGVKINTDQSATNNYTTYGLYSDTDSEAPSTYTYGIRSEATGNYYTYGLHSTGSSTTRSPYGLYASSTVPSSASDNTYDSYGVSTITSNYGTGNAYGSYNRGYQYGTSGLAYGTYSYAYGSDTGTAYGIYSRAYKTSSDTAGTAYGGYFVGDNNYDGATSYGIHASATGAGTNYGVYGTASGGTDNYAGYFTTSAQGGYGIYSKVNYSGSGLKYAGYFECDSETGYGVYATVNGEYTNWAFRGEGTGTGSSGGWFSTTAEDMTAVYGTATSTSGTSNTNKGGYFTAYGDRGYGVYARAYGEYGTGIYASGGTSGYAAQFYGNVKIIGRSSGTTVMELGEGLDYAEGFDISAEDKIEPGSVLVIDADNPGKLALSNNSYDTKVAGIVAGAKGLGSGVRLGAGQFDYDVALAGRVYCKVDATEEAVQPGDLLTTSATPGYAMKAADYTRSHGAILGKAMESIEKGQKGQILVLVTLQ